MSKEHQVSIWRGGEDGRFEEFSVPARESQTVLDIVTWVQRNIDPTLTYRFACRVGMCGSCAMTVNGAPRWTCRTHASKVTKAEKLKIEPLRNMPVIKDLACDMSEFFDKWKRAEARFHPTKSRHDPIEIIDPKSPERVAANEGIECINCGVCYASCDTVNWNDDYLGPAALNRAWTLVNDTRDGGQAARLRAISQDGGCHACHSHQSCQTYCPNDLNPTASIAGLKKRTMQAFLKGELK
ncbi:MAG: succinate dehydrogenase/fumarate reductase iron-sulfur subunit [Hyphomicrobiales bacterium]